MCLTYLNSLLSGLGLSVIQSPSFQVVLIFFTVHAFVDCLASQTVLLTTYGAVEHVYLIFIGTPKAQKVINTSAISKCFQQTSTKEWDNQIYYYYYCFLLWKLPLLVTSVAAYRYN